MSKVQLQHCNAVLHNSLEKEAHFLDCSIVGLLCSAVYSLEHPIVNEYFHMLIRGTLSCCTLV